MRLVFALFLVFALTACKTKHHATGERAESHRLALSVGQGEWGELTSNTRQFDSLTLTIDYFDTLGRLRERARLERKSRAERTDSQRHQRTDSALLLGATEAEERTEVSATSSPPVSVSLWLWLLALALALFFIWRIVRLLRI